MFASLVSQLRSASIEDKKLSFDVFWTTGSFFILAVSGVVINLCIAVFRDAVALGVFNLSYAVYIVVSQLAVLGVHFSVLRGAAHYDSCSVERKRMLWTAMIISLLSGSMFGWAVFVSENLFSQFFNSMEAGRAISYAGMGLVLFPLNKVIISYINGVRHMRAFSIFQAAKYLLVMAWVAWISIASYMDFALASLAFLVAEAITAVVSLAYLVKSGFLGRIHFDREWAVSHLKFGLKSLPSGMFLEVNTRVDVMVIAFFLGDREVGIYSFAAMLVDGLYHILSMVRVNFNPLLVAAKRENCWYEPRRLLSLTKKYIMPGMFLLSVFTLAGYYVVVKYLLGSVELMEGVAPLAILLIGLSLISTYIPFSNMLMVSGYPVYQTFQNFIVVTANAVMNIVFVPFLGITGAALGTSISYLVGFVVLMLFSKRLIGWNILNNIMVDK